jgi:hypothetical protein
MSGWIETKCTRCPETFRYWYFGNRGRRRKYCLCCRKIAHQERNAATAAFVSEQRRARREAASC